jgi:acyl-CoA synthetase (AMP-forming)/AMP-acid ligase II
MLQQSEFSFNHKNTVCYEAQIRVELQYSECGDTHAATHRVYQQSLSWWGASIVGAVTVPMSPFQRQQEVYACIQGTGWQRGLLTT